MDRQLASWRRIGVLVLAGMLAVSTLIPGAAETATASAATPGVADQFDDLELAGPRDELAFAAQAGDVEGSSIIGGPIEQSKGWTPEEMRSAKPLPPSKATGGSDEAVDADGAGAGGPPGF